LIFEIDDQNLLLKLFSGEAEQLILPDTDMVRRDFLADVNTLMPALEAMRDPEGPPVILDIGAGLDKRVARALLAAKAQKYMNIAERGTAILLPTLPDADYVRGAAKAGKRLHTSLPDAAVFVCLRNPNEIAFSASAQEIWDRDLAPHVARFGLLKMPEFERATIQIVEKLERSIFDLSSMDPSDLGHQLNCSPMIAEALVDSLHVNVDAWREQIELKGFFA
jgi:hypothetical protein